MAGEFNLDKLAKAFDEQKKMEENIFQFDYVAEFAKSWNFIAEFIVHVHVTGDEPDIEIVNRKQLVVCDGLNGDCYYDECLSNAEPKDFMPTGENGDVTLDPEQWPEGYYRLTYGAQTHGEKYWTDCGYEYDAWETYELISKYKFNDDEAKYVEPREEGLYY